MNLRKLGTILKSEFEGVTVTTKNGCLEVGCGGERVRFQKGRRYSMGEIAERLERLPNVNVMSAGLRIEIGSRDIELSETTELVGAGTSFV